MVQPPVPRDTSGRDRLALLGVLVLLLLWMGLRLATRRPDSSRVPRRPDVLVLHPVGLRADAVPPEALAADLGLPEGDAFVWAAALAQSTDAPRSAVAALSGQLARDVRWPPGPTLPSRLGDAGYERILFDDAGLLAAAAASAFDVVVPAQEGLDGFVSRWVAPGSAPRFAFVHWGGDQAALQSLSTAAGALRSAYAERVPRLREQIRRLARRRGRPLLVVLLGASGASLGEHPRGGDRLYDPLLAVPFIIGLRGRGDLPAGWEGQGVTSADLAPTLVDLLDLPPLDVEPGRSLEDTLQGWSAEPVHSHLILRSARWAAVRDDRWKLMCPVDRRRLQRSTCELYSLEEDPGEREDLLRHRSYGPAAEALFGLLAEAERGS